MSNPPQKSGNEVAGFAHPEAGTMTTDDGRGLLLFPWESRTRIMRGKVLMFGGSLRVTVGEDRA